MSRARADDIRKTRKTSEFTSGFQEKKLGESFANAFFDQMEMVNIDAFFYWYVEVMGKRLSRGQSGGSHLS
jgi:hypothetical protein